MARRLRAAGWSRLFARSLKAITRGAARSGTRALKRAAQPKPVKRGVAAGAGTWIPGMAVGSAGARRFWLYRPPGVSRSERLPLLVMLHGCGQDAKGFALSTRMNSVAARERSWVLYPEQDRLANAQGCWNWFDTRSGRAQGEAALIVNAIDQVCLLHPIDRERVAVAGLSAGASMAALLATRHPDRFKAVVMHSGVPPGTADSTLSALGAMHGRRGTRPLASSRGPDPTDWPPLLVIHGSADHVVSAHNAQAAAQVWATAAGALALAPRRVQRGKRHPMLVTDFKQRGRTAATLVEVEGLGHAWSGGAARASFSDALGPDASRLAWAFVSKQFERVERPL
ncbi:MAG: PHB depolymerase family esterase [Burkholderiales bacterium]|nr:PHB depolymerase family esterase [Burkholderiales bacterium]